MICPRPLVFFLAGIFSASTAVQAEGLVLLGCRVEVVDEVDIPAQKEGVLIELPLREGSRVQEGDLLASIDDREAQAQLRIAEYGLNAAQKRAEDTVEERYATKAAEVAKVDWELTLAANQMKPNAVAEIETMQKKLAWERAVLQIEKAQKDRELALLDADTKIAERDAAIVALEKRTITAPFGGEVVELSKQESEWVSPGETILKLSRYDKLYVTGYVNASEYDRSEVRNRPVTVVVPRARGNQVTVQGKVVYVARLIDGSDSYTVRAEIENTLEDDDWVIQPGKHAQMTVHLE